MILERFEKQPSEVKDYDINYSDWLTPMGDTLVSATASVICVTNPDDTALLVQSVLVTHYGVKLWMAGGTDRARYKVTVMASTTGGRLDESELMFTIKEH